MPRSAVLLFAAICVFLEAQDPPPWRPDRAVSVDAIERVAANTFRVKAKAWLLRSSKEPTLYYQLSCASAAAHLDVGTVYNALEGFTSDNDTIKVLIIFGVPAPPTPNKTISIACDVEIVRSIDQSR